MTDIYQSNIILKYTNCAREQQFQQQQTVLIKQQFLSLGLFMCVIYLLYFLSNLLWFEDQLNGFIRLGQSVAMLTSLMLAQRCSKIIIWSLLIQEVIHLILNTELFYMARLNHINANSDQIDKKEFFSFGCSLTIYVFSIMYITKQWYLKTLQVILINYTLIRLSTQLNVSILIIQLFLIQLGVLFYLQERNERNHYYEYLEQGKNINELKFFINQLMPAPFFVIQQKSMDSKDSQTKQQLQKLQTVYHNNRTLHEIKQTDYNQIINYCEKLYYEDNSYLQASPIINQKTTSRRLSQMLMEELQLLNIQLKKSLEKVDAFKQQPYELFEEKTYNNCYFSEINALNQELSDQQKKKLNVFYDIKVVRCIWNNEPSLMVMLIDVSQKIINNRLLIEADQYKNQLLASVTHDLKNPLNGIITMLQSSQHMDNLDKIRHNLNTILKTSHLFLSLINDILDYSQIIKGKLRLSPSFFNFQSLVKDVFDLFNLAAQQKGIQLNLDVKQIGKNQLIIYNDETRLKQILINLIGNALKFTYTGSVSVIIEQEPDIAKCLKISVKDTGVGIPKNIMNQLFQVFATFDDNRGSNKFGIGLGLHICKMIVKELGPLDTLLVQSYQNLGSTFSFIIYQDIEIEAPVSQNNTNSAQQLNNINEINHNAINLNIQENFDEQSIQELKDPENKFNVDLQYHYKSSFFYKKKKQRDRQTVWRKPSIEQTIQQHQIVHSQQKILEDEQISKFNFNQVNNRLLIVDDDQFNIYGFICMMRQFENIKVDPACNGQQAINKVMAAQEQGKQYSFVITDINMPIMGGIEEITELRKLINQKKIERLTIIAVTSDSDSLQQSFEAGADYVLNKPIHFDKIVNILTKQINL